MPQQNWAKEREKDQRTDLTTEGQVPRRLVLDVRWFKAPGRSRRVLQKLLGTYDAHGRLSTEWVDVVEDDIEPVDHTPGPIEE